MGPIAYFLCQKPVIGVAMFVTVIPASRIRSATTFTHRLWFLTGSLRFGARPIMDKCALALLIGAPVGPECAGQCADNRPEYKRILRPGMPAR
jgi:hypothetical protein